MIVFDAVNDEINLFFYNAWKLNTPAIVGYIPEVRWQNVQYVGIPDSTKFWARLTKNTVLEAQHTLSPGFKKWTAQGLIFVQLFCPKSVSLSFELGQQLAVVARDAFRGKSTDGCIWFRNSTITELDAEELYYRLNVVSEFTYDELK